MNPYLVAAICIVGTVGVWTIASFAARMTAGISARIRRTNTRPLFSSSRGTRRDAIDSPVGSAGAPVFSFGFESIEMEWTR